MIKRAGRAVVLFVALVPVACCLPKSAADVAKENAAYALALDRCELISAKCLEYVECRRRAAAAVGRTYGGRCLP